MVCPSSKGKKRKAASGYYGADAEELSRVAEFYACRAAFQVAIGMPARNPGEPDRQSRVLCMDSDRCSSYPKPCHMSLLRSTFALVQCAWSHAQRQYAIAVDPSLSVPRIDPAHLEKSSPSDEQKANQVERDPLGPKARMQLHV
jgi:hypothetical protein